MNEAVKRALALAHDFADFLALFDDKEMLERLEEVETEIAEIENLLK